MIKFIDSNGKHYNSNDPELVEAIDEVSIFFLILAFRKFIADDYADHVHENTKIDNFLKEIQSAIEIKNGRIDNFTVSQRINTILTGECVPLL